MMKHTSAIAFALWISLAGQAWAKDSSYRSAVGAASAAASIGQDLDTAHRVPGPGLAASVEQLLALIATDVSAAKGAPQFLAAGQDYSLAVGKGWLLDVRGDGNWVRFVSESYRAEAGVPSVSVENRMSESELDFRGREFISATLADHVVLGASERLELWRTAYEIEVGGPVDGPMDRRVVGNRVVFTRVLDDVPVLGPGSKVAVTFANDGKVIGFQYDWSALVKSGKAKATAPPTVVRSRLDEIAKRHAFPSTASVKERLECGYYDVGARVPSSSGVLQAGCMARSIVRNGGLLQAYVDTAPASSQVDMDSAWPETQLISK